MGDLRRFANSSISLKTISEEVANAQKLLLKVANEPDPLRARMQLVQVRKIFFSFGESLRIVEQMMELDELERSYNGPRDLT